MKGRDDYVYFLSDRKIVASLPFAASLFLPVVLGVFLASVLKGSSPSKQFESRWQRKLRKPGET